MRRKKWARYVKNRKFKVKMTVFFTEMLFLYFIAFGVLLYLSERFGFSLRRLKNPVLVLFLIGLLGFLLSSASYWFLIRKISAPMKELDQILKQAAKGDFSVQVQGKSGIAEIDTVLATFNRMLQELNSVEMLRNDFIANVSHEFKTPLSSIVGYVTLLQDPDLMEAERTEYTQKVFSHIEKLNDLTENILQLSRLENQKYPAATESYRLDEQIREAIVLLEPKWSEKHMCLDIELDPILYDGPRALLFQVWMNLISNAVKFSYDGGNLYIRLSGAGSRIKATISDEGIGMSPETQAHIFEKFYQGDTSHRAQGNGLGLALCQEILKKCDGRIYVTSELEKGSVFVVTLKKTNACE